MNKPFFNLCSFLILLSANLVLARVENESLIWSENFENGWGEWTVSNGVWHIDTLKIGPETMINGKCLAGTNLKGNYSSLANSILKSPWITLPPVNIDESLWLYFEHWFKIDETDAFGPDKGTVKVSTDGVNWTPVSRDISGIGSCWSHYSIDLTTYQNLSVKIGFDFNSNQRTENLGWYIDSLSIVQGPNNTKAFFDFESPNEQWFADNGLWQIGTPDSNGCSSFSGCCCAGTVLNGNYYSNADSRFISPPFRMPTKTKERILLTFWHCFRINETDAFGPDKGHVQIAVNQGPWTTIGPYFSGNSQGWTPEDRDLTAYADSLVQVAFLFESNQRSQDAGWYIDDVRITGLQTNVSYKKATPDNFCLYQNYPNPFNPQTTIKYNLKTNEHVRLMIYDIHGKTVRTLVDDEMASGIHMTLWDGLDETGDAVPSGVYLYKLSTGKFNRTRKMIVAR